MEETPTDLMSLTDVLKEFKPRRSFWVTQINEGRITSYRIPGTRGIYLSRADVEQLLRPQRLEIRWKPKEEPTE